MIEAFNGDFIQWLRGFYALATTNSVSEAARRVNRSNPTILYQLRCLEEAFDAPLFHRGPMGLELTEQGTVLLRKTIAIFQLIEEARSELGQAREELILATNHFMLPFFSSFAESFRDTHPRTELRIMGCRTQESIRSVLSFSAHCGIVPAVPLPRSVAALPLLRTRLALITAAGNPFSLAAPLSPETIASLPFIAFAPDGTIHAQICGWLARHGLQPSVVQYQRHFATIRQLVEMGKGVTIVDREALGTSTEKLAVFDLDGLLPPREWIFIRAKDRPLSPAGAAFVRWIEAERTGKG